MKIDSTNGKWEVHEPMEDGTIKITYYVLKKDAIAYFKANCKGVKGAFIQPNENFPIKEEEYVVTIKKRCVDKSFYFNSLDGSLSFDEAMSKFLELVTEVTGETITSDLRDKYINYYEEGKLPITIHGYILNIKHIDN
jgi:hypothetical protein